MSWLEAILLGLIQGLTEFLPVSSSGHLVLAEHLLGMRNAEENLFVTAVLHLGSLAAILIYYARDLLKLRLRDLGLIALASVPAAVVGLTLKDSIEQLFAMPQWVCGGLVVTGVFLWIAERFGRSDREPGWRSSLWVGLAQAVAILPGVSRSGSTIGTAYLCGVRRPDAVRFSFLLGIPVIGGAILLQLLKADRIDVPTGPLALSVAICFVVSLGALKLLEFVAVKGKLRLFSIYCIAVGIAGAIALRT